MAELVILGNHGAFRDEFEHTSTAAAVICGDDVFLIDCGMNALVALKSAMDIDVGDIVGVFVTHCHGDHVGGIEELAFRQYYMHKKRLTVIAPEPVWEELQCYLDATLTPYNRRDGEIGHCLRGIINPVRLPMVDLSEHSESLPWLDLDAALRVVAYPVVHVPQKPCYSYFITFESSKKNIWWSGDCVFDEQMLRNIGLRTTQLFCDCNMGKPYPGTVHAHYDELITLPASVQKQLVAIHHSTPAGATPPGLKFAQQYDTFRF